jgi:hypothetical protein
VIKTLNDYLQRQYYTTKYQQELHLIDKMWREYSGDRFGLTVQKQIWQSILDNQKTHWQAWCSFGDRVG